jgi:hypothetical protein
MFSESAEVLPPPPAEVGVGIEFNQQVKESIGSSIAKRLRTRREPPPLPADGTIAGYVPTDEQQLVIDDAKLIQVADGPRVLVIVAGAGSGKTSNLKMLECVLSGRGQYTAFNRALVIESKGSFKRAKCNTTHSLAFQAEGKRFAHRLSGRRLRSHQVAEMLGIEGVVIDVVDEAGIPQLKPLATGFLAGQVMTALRRFCQSADAEPAEHHFKPISGIDQARVGQRGVPIGPNNVKVRAYLLPYLKAAWQDACDPEGVLPYSADYYVKLWERSNPVIAADYILLDEAQDTAEVMLSILQQQKHAMIILVGDDNQSIYEWRGAVNAMQAFPGAKRRLLTLSFRFGQKIADVANAILDNLRTPTDLRLRGLPDRNSRVARLNRPDCILCRTNAGAVGKVLAAINEGLRPHLIGGSGEVIEFVRAAIDLQAGKPTDHQEIGCFASWAEVQEYAKTDEGEDIRLLVRIIDDFTAEAILKALSNMPEEDEADLVVSTAHKSKGRQWDTVKLAEDFPPLSRMWDADVRLLYVAATRAKYVLDVSECPPFGEEDGIYVHQESAVADLDKSPPPPAVPAPVPAPAPAQAVPPVSSPVAPTRVPAPATKLRATGFTWGKWEGRWVLRGPLGVREGDEVEVVKQSGDRQWIEVGKVIREFRDACLYEPVRRGR